MNPTQNKYATQGRPIGTTGQSTPTAPGPAPAPQSASATGATAAQGAQSIPGTYTTPSGRNSTLYQGMGFRKRIRIEKAARLCATGLYTDILVAQHLGISTTYLTQLKSTVPFQQAMIACVSGVLSEENQKSLATLEARRQELDAMVPMALMQLRNLALSTNPGIALKANLEILDRDGNFSKVSRTSVELKTQEDLTTATSVGNTIMDILRGTAHVAVSTQPGSIEADAISGIAPGFTLSSTEAKAQVKLMGEEITERTLEAIDAATTTVQ